MSYSLSINNKDVSKRSIIEMAKEMAEKSPNPLEALILARKLEDLAKTLRENLSPVILDQIGDGDILEQIGAKVSASGGGFVCKTGDEKAFGHNPEWIEAVERLKGIETAMKAAAKNKFAVSIDPDTGEEIPPAKPQPRKPYLTITY